MARAAWLVVALILAACDEPAADTCVSACTTPEPGPDECAVKLILDAGCAVFFDAAEVALGQCLEPAMIHPGEEFVTCGRVAVGSKLLWTVRSPEFVPSELGLVGFVCPGASSPDEPCDWQWGPWQDTCPQGGLTPTYGISCQ